MLLEMYKNGEIDATTAMQMIADLGKAEVNPGNPNKRQRSVSPQKVPGSEKDHKEDDAHSTAGTTLLDSLLLFEGNGFRYTYPIFIFFRL